MIRKTIRRWEDYIKVEFQNQPVGSEGVDWILLAQDEDLWRAPLNTAVTTRDPVESGGQKALH
jgi:hypothetical protein